MPKLSIVVPAYNEESRLRRMLEAYVPYFAQRYGNDVELLVVVNGSTDRTEQVAREVAARSPIVRVLTEPQKIGKGGAIMMGFRATSGELVGFVDADGATPPEAFQDLVERLGQADCIIASRWLPESKVSPPQPWSRRAASRVFNWLVRRLFGLRIRDTQCGAKLVRRKAVETILPHLGVTRWAFDVDFLFQLRRAGFSIVETPTTWHDIAGSRVKVVRCSIEMLLAILRLRLLYSPLRWIVTLYEKTLGQVIHLKV